MSNYKLTVVDSKVLEKGICFPLEKGRYQVGRVDQDNQIVLKDKSVSRAHCYFEVEDTRVFIEDLGSGNGSRVNDRRITKKFPLKVRDKIKLGDTVLEFLQDIDEGDEEATQVMQAEDVEKEMKEAAEQKNLNQPALDQKSPFDFKVWIQKKNSKIILGVVGILLLLIIFSSLSGGSKSKQRSQWISPKKLKPTAIYLESRQGYQFKYPPKWRVITKRQKSVIGETYLKQYRLIVGHSDYTKMLMFGVEILVGIPHTFDLNKSAKASKKVFPRMFAHETALQNTQTLTIAGKKAFLGEGGPFVYKGKTLKTLEVCILDQDRRILLIGIADASYFNESKKLFTSMIQSFSLEKYESLMKKPVDLKMTLAGLIKAGDTLTQNKEIVAENLFEGIQAYSRAIYYLNTFDYRPNSGDFQKLLKKVRDASKELNQTYKDLKFQLERGIKVNDRREIKRAAKSIMKRIPDTSDERYKKAALYI